MQSEVKLLLSTEHFSVDGTLVEAWASMKSNRHDKWVRPDIRLSIDYAEK
jgi:hypothetical protein